MQAVMVGSVCGESNPVGREIRRDFSRGYLSCDKFVAAGGTRILTNSRTEGMRVEAGKSNSVGIDIPDLIANSAPFETLKQALKIEPDSRLLFLGLPT